MYCHCLGRECLCEGICPNEPSGLSTVRNRLDHADQDGRASGLCFSLNIIVMMFPGRKPEGPIWPWPGSRPG